MRGGEGVVRLHPMRERRFYYVYILANASELFYVGVTSSLFRRVDEHRAGAANAFTRRNYIRRLVYCERYLWVDRAIAREKQLKGWRKEKKRALIEKANPQKHDMRNYGVLTFGDSYVGTVPAKHLKMVLDATKRQRFGD